jgi:hypothetical protein
VDRAHLGNLLKTDRIRPSACRGANVCSNEDGRPVPEAFIRNLKQPMPLATKLRLVLRNSAIKITRMQSCCGHPGEPGC